MAVSAAVVLLPVAYVLSVGPVYFCVSKGYIPVGIVDVLYAPVEWLSHNVEFAARTLRWYLSFYGI